MANLPLRSMTGFARARRPLGDGEMVVSVKTLNHRSLGRACARALGRRSVRKRRCARW